MLKKIKNQLYFVVAQYFRYLAIIQLRKWQPRIIVVTGSNGKTTTMHLLEAQLGTQAVYSHGANSTYGIPFHLLGLQRITYSLTEWIKIKCLQRALRLHVLQVVCHEQLSLDQVNIRFDTAKAVVQRVQQRASMLIVVVSVSARQGNESGLGEFRREGEKHSPVQEEDNLY